MRVFRAHLNEAKIRRSRILPFLKGTLCNAQKGLSIAGGQIRTASLTYLRDPSLSGVGLARASRALGCLLPSPPSPRVLVPIERGGC